MTNPWLAIVASLPLSRTEREVLRRFEAEPLGRSFLPVADILRTHRLIDESLELLTQGLARHPGFTVARVVLARELLAKGMVDFAWRTLEDSPVPLRDNLLAQKLRFKLALLIGNNDAANAVHHQLKAQQMLDAELKRLGDVFEVSGIEVARRQLELEFEARGITLALPTPVRTTPEPQEAVDEEPMPLDPPPQTASPYFQDDRLEDDPAVNGFHVVPLDEIFRPGAHDGARSFSHGGGIELDSTTLADIYARQGHYGRALEVYRRLLRMTPHNEFLRHKVAELARLEKEQRDVDLGVDPAVVDRMEAVEILDRQIRFFNDLLTRLT